MNLRKMRNDIRVVVSGNGKDIFDITLDRKINIILDYSSSGKSYLCDVIRKLGGAYKRLDSCTTLEFVSPIYDSKINWVNYIKDISNHIIFLDEDFNTSYSGDFVKEINKSDNIYVIITRVLPRRLTYSAYSIHNLIKSDNILSLEKTLKFNSDINTIEDLIVEDSGLGYRFIEDTFTGTATNVIQSKGKSDVVNNLKKVKGKREVYLFVDLESFGSMLYVSRVANRRIQDIILINIGSFEKAIMEIYFKQVLFDILNNPHHYCDYKLYSNMERFFTKVLKDYMKGIGIVYAKNGSEDLEKFLFNRAVNLGYILSRKCARLTNRFSVKGVKQEDISNKLYESFMINLANRNEEN